MTPFFTCMDKVVDAGSTPIPFEVTVPVPAMLFGKSGNVTAIVIKPGDTAIDFPEPGVAQVQVFGSGTKLKAIR